MFSGGEGIRITLVACIHKALYFVKIANTVRINDEKDSWYFIYKYNYYDMQYPYIFNETFAEKSEVVLSAKIFRLKLKRR